MTTIETETTVFDELVQGSWLRGKTISALINKEFGEDQDSSNDGIVILSQTCDVLSKSKERVIVAPVRVAGKELFANASRGKTPLFIPISERDSRDAFRVIDLMYCFSIPKSNISQGITHRELVNVEDATDVMQFSNRLARLFTRFPFPDEIHDFLKKLQDKVRSKSGKTNSPLGAALECVKYIRISCSDWNSKHRHIAFFFIIDSCFMVSADEEIYDEGAIEGLHGKSLEDCDFNEICLLIGKNKNDKFAMSMLWANFENTFAKGIWGSSENISDEVQSVICSCTSEDDFSISQWDRTFSLDLESLSYSEIN